MSAQALRVMADSMVFHACLKPTPDGAALLRAIAEGRLELVVTHVQQTEHAENPDDEERLRVLAVPRSVIGASVFVLGQSRLGIDSMGDGAVYKAVYGGANPKRVRDAMIADTALAVGIPLVTSDEKLQGRAERAGVEVWSVPTLLDQLSR